MLSLPSLHPPAAPLPSTLHHHPPSPPNRPPNQPPNTNTNTTTPLPPTSLLLATLRADELSIQNRKASIRRFGAGWLRPPGIPKTLQGIADERAEREEQELVASREAAMMEAQAEAEAQEEAAAREEAERMMVENGEGEDEGGMNLDDEVPDASEIVGDVAGEGWESSSDGGEEENGDQENDGMRQQGIRREDEMREIDIAVDADVGASFTGVGEEGEGDYGVPGMLEGGRDLDEDVPEAGSYQHTDTEVEDESDIEEGGSFVIGGGGEGVLGRSAWGGSPLAVAVGGGYDGAGGGNRMRAGRRSGGRSSRGRESRG
ncbi:MAG: hypothetical protein Q9220_005448 [cf. Caloplaca sp. 1 TL-2023]